MTTMTWFGFGDLAVGDAFRFDYSGGASVPRLSAVLVKIAPRMARDGDGNVWSTPAGATVVRAS